jgi:lysozyme family protein
LGTANYVKGLPAKVWLIGGEQGVAEGRDKKEATRRIQKMLNDKYKANLDVDGILGPLTLKSINKFIPDARTELADEPNKTTAVQGKKVKEQNVTEMDGQNFVGGMTASYQDQENQPIDEDYIDEKWSQKYKSSINCASPRGFSQRAHCAGRKK